MCNNNWWIIIFLLLFGENMGGSGCGNGNCGCSGNNMYWIIIFLLLFNNEGFLGNGCGGSIGGDCGCGNDCGCGC